LGEAQRLFGPAGDRSTARKQGTAPERNPLRLPWLPRRFGSRLWKLSGAGHVWPGGKPKVLERILGPSTEIIAANQEMWNFFQRFSLRS